MERVAALTAAQLHPIADDALRAESALARSIFDRVAVDHVLIGSVSAKAAGKRGPAPKIQQQLERVSALPKAKQRVISEVLDSLLAQASR